MDDKQTRLQNRIEPQIQEIKQQCKTVMLATVDNNGQPNVSYAPFALSENGYYIFISDIARHARNLKDNPKASIMLIEDEQNARQIFARNRLSFNVNAIAIKHGSDEWSTGTKLLRQRHGDVMDHLVTMQDFTLFNLVPVDSGLFVKGFGQAFQVSNNTVDTVHLDQGHQQRT